MKYLSLFSGIGGFELGIIKAYVETTTRSKERGSEKDSQGNERQRLQSKKGQNITDKERQHSEHIGNELDEGQPTCIGYSEIDKYAIQIYQSKFPEHKNYGDCTKINVQELPDFDLLVGGFPCQAFSIAGKRRGFDDTRGTLFFDIARILKEKRPRNFILENVKGLLSHDNGRTFKTIISTLTELGYCVEWQVLNAKNFGVPQNRERVFIVGHLGGIPERKVFPITSTNDSHIKYTTMSRQQQDRTVSPEGISPCLASNTTFDKWNVDNGVKIRRLTPLECERLMGYPDGWTEGLSDTQRYKTLGNGIVSNVVEEVVKRLL